MRGFPEPVVWINLDCGFHEIEEKIKSSDPTFHNNIVFRELDAWWRPGCSWSLSLHCSFLFSSLEPALPTIEHHCSGGLETERAPGVPNPKLGPALHAVEEKKSEKATRMKTRECQIKWSRQSTLTKGLYISLYLFLTSLLPQISKLSSDLPHVLSLTMYTSRVSLLLWRYIMSGSIEFTDCQ